MHNGVKPFNPLRLIKDVSASIVIDQSATSDHPLAKSVYNGHVLIFSVNAQRTQQIAEDSWLSATLPQPAWGRKRGGLGSSASFGDYRPGFKALVERVRVGAVLREIAKHRYETSTRAPRLPQDSVTELIDTVLEENRVEYHLSYDYPVAVPFLKVLLGAVKPELTLDRTRWLSMKSYYAQDKAQLQALEQVFLALPQLRADLEATWWLVRFGVAIADADPELVNFVLPLALTARRGSRQDATLATELIYAFIISRYLREAEQQQSDGDGEGEGQQGQGAAGASGGAGDGGPTPAQLAEAARQLLASMRLDEKAISDKQLSDALGDGDEVSQSGVRDLAEQAQEDDQAGGKRPGTEFVPVDLSQQDFAFFRQTVDKHRELIVKLREAFRVRFDSFAVQRTKEGELNLRPTTLVQAHLDSITRDENRTHLRRARALTRLDVVVLRDISGSTSGMMVPYAEATTCLLTALEGLPGVKTGWIDFNGGAQIIMRPEERIYEVAINPISQGGTQLEPALAKMDQLHFSSNKRLVFIVTDGEIGDRYRLAHRLEQYKQQGYHFVWLNVHPEDVSFLDYKSDLINCGLSQLPLVAAHHVLAHSQEQGVPS